MGRGKSILVKKAITFKFDEHLLRELKGIHGIMKERYDGAGAFTFTAFITKGLNNWLWSVEMREFREEYSRREEEKKNAYVEAKKNGKIKEADW